MMSVALIQIALPRKPKLAQLARYWKCSHDEALGGMVRWLCWLNEHTPDGRTGLTAAELNTLVFAGAYRVAGLVKLGWAETDKAGLVSATEFDKYNSRQAKARLKECEKKRRQKANKIKKPEQENDIYENDKN